ncbi:hypothetical protein BpHYR1_022656, partial [Brachionus plicatilis]
VSFLDSIIIAINFIKISKKKKHKLNSNLILKISIQRISFDYLINSFIQKNIEPNSININDFTFILEIKKSEFIINYQQSIIIYLIIF